MNKRNTLSYHPANCRCRRCSGPITGGGASKRRPQPALFYLAWVVAFWAAIFWLAVALLG